MYLTNQLYQRCFIFGLRRKILEACAIFALILCAQQMVFAASAQTEKQKDKPVAAEVRVIAPGGVAARELKAGQSHAYSFEAAKGQYIHAVVELRGELLVFMQTPDGKRVEGSLSPGLNRKLISFSHIAQTSGVYRLEVRPIANISGQSLSYEARLEALRDVTPQDEKLVIAEELMTHAAELYTKTDTKSLRDAIVELKQSLALRREIGDRVWEAETLSRLAYVHHLLKEYQHALDYNLKALSIWRSLGVRFLEAASLRDIAVFYLALESKDKAEIYLEQALKMSRSVYDRHELLRTLNDAAAIYKHLGNNQKALDLYEEMLQTVQQAGDHSGEAAVLNYIGHIYAASGDDQRALQVLTRAYFAADRARDVEQQQHALANIIISAPSHSTSSIRRLGLDFPDDRASAAVASAKSEANVPVQGQGRPAGRNVDTRTSAAQASPGHIKADRSNTLRYPNLPTDELNLWNDVEKSAGAADFAAYLKLYPRGRFAQIAKSRLQAHVGNVGTNPTTLRRFPTIEAQDPVEVGVQFALQVLLLKDALKGGGGTPSSPPVQLQGTKHTQPWKVEVILSAQDFEIVGGSNLVTINIPPDSDSTPAVFRLKPKSIAGERQTSKVFVTIMHEENFLSRISHDITIVSPQAQNRSGAQDVKPKDESILSLPGKVTVSPGTRRPLSDEAEKKTLNPPRTEDKSRVSGEAHSAPPVEKVSRDDVRQYPQVSLVKNRPAADLTVVLIEGLDALHPEQTYIQVESKLFKSAMTFTRHPGQQGWIDDGYELFSRMSTQRAKASVKPGVNTPVSGSTPAPELAVSQARGFGRELYLKYAPELFKSAFWKLRDELGDGFRSIQIYTNNPNFPWELMRPVRSDGTDERDFLGIEYAVGRWHQHNTTELQKIPLVSATVSEIAVIAPKYTGAMVLTHQTEELDALKAIPGFRLVPGKIEDVKHLFGQFPQGIIHFAGHGVVVELPGKSQQFSIVLEDGQINLVAWHGMVSRQSGRHPFIFFNACDLGRTRRVANSIDGWAAATVEAGASGYIGALWPLNDQGAAQFGTDFYQTLMTQLQEGPIFVADVLRLTRKKFIQNNDPTYLGYVFYGDPNLKLVSDHKKD